ncbi:MAG: CmpA/NrtA family ABC transporter substrate-binding protein [Bosea sp. (in: a-proteobacteria)]
MANGTNRRQLLKLSAAASTFLATKSLFPAGVFAQGTGPEVKGTKLGFIALTDACPLIIAKEKGFYAKHGMPDVDVVKQASWPATRDNVALGSERNGIDGAHMLSTIPYLMHAGKITQNSIPVPMAMLARCHLDGQSISVSNEFADLKVGLDASPLKAAIAKRKAAGKEFTAAHTFPMGTHDLWIRYWFAAAGIDPDKDLKLIPVPPPQMVANMKVGNMDAFCVAEPWHGQLVNQKIGYTALTTDEMWGLHPDKSFAMRADFVEKKPKATQALLMALFEAQMWCDKPENKLELAEIVGKRQWINAPVSDIAGRLAGEFDFGNGRTAKNPAQAMKYWEKNASFAWHSHDAYMLYEIMRWGKLEPNFDVKGIVDTVGRVDVWRDAAKALGVPASDIPQSNSRGVETFFDGVKFDPADPMAYLKAVKIKRIAI